MKLSKSSNNKGKNKEEKDPDAMDIDGMTAGKRAYLMKKGACFKCEKPGHLARDCEDQETKDEKKKDKGKVPQKKDLKAIHALSRGLPKRRKWNFLPFPRRRKRQKRSLRRKRIFEKENCLDVGVS